MAGIGGGVAGHWWGSGWASVREWLGIGGGVAGHRWGSGWALVGGVAGH